MSTAPCNWNPVVPENCGCDPSDEDMQAAMTDMAVEMLWAWTGRRFGVCEVSVRPCREDCQQYTTSTFWGPRGGSLGGTGWVPVLFQGKWHNLRCGQCPGACSCGVNDARALVLPGNPQEITRIMIEGEELPTGAYTLRDGVLRRVDGGAWPLCNDEFGDPALPDSGAWEITFKTGTPVPDSGNIVAGLLACELMKAACGDKTCQLPQRVQSVTRQGVSIGAVLDSFEDLKEGRTGIWLIDSWVAQMNAPRPAISQVFSPDLPRQRGTLGAIGRGL